MTQTTKIITGARPPRSPGHPMTRAIEAGRQRRAIRRDPAPWDRGTRRRGASLFKTQGR